jgi:hypothetical protein
MEQSLIVRRVTGAFPDPHPGRVVLRLPRSVTFEASRWIFVASPSTVLSVCLHLQYALASRDSKEPILSKPATARDSRVRWLGCLDLYDEELVLSGWGWTGPAEERIPLSSIDAVEKWSATEGPNLRIHSQDRSRPLELRVTGAVFWAQALQERGVTVKRKH